ncbi:hypothetical protein [Pikeienuella sp. HZG-20]|uniref:hypothetical protein n=1 Tax=Paludibacillus litoralis TaxID=3133267 RepID=UPI0030EE0E05
MAEAGRSSGARVHPVRAGGVYEIRVALQAGADDASGGAGALRLTPVPIARNLF